MITRNRSFVSSEGLDIESTSPRLRRGGGWGVGVEEAYYPTGIGTWNLSMPVQCLEHLVTLDRPVFCSSSVQFSSRWYLCAQEGPYASLRSFPNVAQCWSGWRWPFLVLSRKIFFLRLPPLGDRWSDVLGFETSCSVSSSSTLQIFRDYASRLWWLLCPPGLFQQHEGGTAPTAIGIISPLFSPPPLPPSRTDPHARCERAAKSVKWSPHPRVTGDIGGCCLLFHAVQSEWKNIGDFNHSHLWE